MDQVKSLKVPYEMIWFLIEATMRVKPRYRIKGKR